MEFTPTLCMRDFCHDIVAPTRACHNKLVMRHAFSLRGMLALLFAALIAGCAAHICSTVVQSNIQTFFGLLWAKRYRVRRAAVGHTNPLQGLRMGIYITLITHTPPPPHPRMDSQYI